MIVIYVCTQHKQAKLDRHEEWSATKYHAAYKLRNRVEIIESVCPECLAAAKKSMNALMEKRYGRHLQAVS